MDGKYHLWLKTALLVSLV